MGAFIRRHGAPVGSTCMHAGEDAPYGYLVCGQAVSRVQYARLYAVIGDKYGPGDGETTFDLPPVNKYSLPSNTDVGGQVGSASHGHTVAGHALDETQIPSHVHPGGGGGGPFAAAGGAFGLKVTADGVPLPNTGATGGGQPHSHGIDNASNIPPSVKYLFCIKY